MYPWRVFVKGRNLLIDVDDEVGKRGLFTTRYVEAEGEAEAAEAALAQVRSDLEGVILNEDFDPPVFSAAEVEAMESRDDFPAETPGLAVFPESGEDPSEPFVSELPVDASFALPRGVSLTDRGGLSEGFEVVPRVDAGHTMIRVNVSADRTAEVYRELSEAVDAPGFLVVETPSNRAVEEELRASDDAPFHVDVHYLDGLESIDHRILFDEFADLLTACGFVAFGFGSHQGIDEVLVDGYKTFTVLSVDPDKYVTRLRALGLPERSPLRTAWNTLGPDTPGERLRQRIDGRTVFDLVEELEDRGLYFAKRREGVV
ncbi:MAG: hypothetical protein AAF726_11865 [Planctomycetota bacterium]